MASKPRQPAGGTRAVVLLRGVNVGGNRKVPMLELRSIATQLGWRDVATYLQSGNLVGATVLDAETAAKQLETALAEHFDFAVPVVVRSGAQFTADLAARPFADTEPERLHVGYSRAPLPAKLAEAVAAYCRAGERVAVRGQALWIDFTGGVARSKLTSAVLDRALGGTVTLRNLRTAQAIAALVATTGQ